MVCTFVDLNKYYFYIVISVKGMHISIADDTKKRFHAARAIQGLKMSQVVVLGKGISSPAKCAVSIHNSLASSMFAIVSSKVSPWVRHHGKSFI